MHTAITTTPQRQLLQRTTPIKHPKLPWAGCHSRRHHPLHARPRTKPPPDDWDAEEAALDAESVDPFSEANDDDDVEYPPELSLDDAQDRLAFVDDPDEFWRLVMDEEAMDEKLFKLAVADSGAANKPNVLARMEKQKSRIAIEKYLELLPQLQEREGFVSDSVYTYEPVEETIPDPLPRHRHNPDWDEWDFRAFLEDQRQRAAVDAAWRAEQAEVGRFEYEVPSWPDDLRFKERPPEDQSEWDEARIMQLITQDGRSPRIEEVCVGMGGEMGGLRARVSLVSRLVACACVDDLKPHVVYLPYCGRWRA